MTGIPFANTVIAPLPPRENGNTMKTKTLTAFDSTLHKTFVWLKDIKQELGWDESDHERAFKALRTVLQALRDRMTVEEISDFAAQLPMLVRGFYYEGWNPAKTPVTERKADEFIKHVADRFEEDITADPEEITRAVLRVVAKHVTAGEVDDVKGSMPKSIRALWG